jgi:hypothetical protein
MARAALAYVCVLLALTCAAAPAPPQPQARAQPQPLPEKARDKPRAEAKKEWLDGATVDELIEYLTELKAKRADTDRQIKEALAELTERVRAQEQKLAALGLRIEEKRAAPDTPGTGPARPPVASVPAVPAVADEFQRAYDADKALHLAGAEDCQALAKIYALAGEALDRVKLPTIGHFRQGIEIQARARLKNRLPSLYALAQRQLLAKLPADDAVLTPQVSAAAKMAALGIAHQLDRVAP